MKIMYPSLKATLGASLIGYYYALALCAYVYTVYKNVRIIIVVYADVCAYVSACVYAGRT